VSALRNPKHEAFARAFVRGAHAGNGAGCYKAVYGKDNRQAASRLLRRDDVVRRVAELQGQVSQIEAKATERALERHEVTKERVIGELAKLGFANMLDYVRPTEDGDVVVDLSRLDRHRAAAVQEVVVDTYVDGSGDDAREVKRVRFKLADKRAALVDLGKHLGLFVERRHVTFEHSDKTDDQLRAELGALTKQLAGLGIDLRLGAGDSDADGGASPTGKPH
jgi:phage terminase small subunit